MFLGVCAYASIQSGLPGKAMETLNQVIKLYDSNFECSRTKRNAIIKGPFFEQAIIAMQKDLQKAKFIAIHFDATTMHNTKMLVLFAKCYVPQIGHIVRCIDLRPITNEDSETVTKCIKDGLTNANIDFEKVIALIADNTNTNFGGPKLQDGTNVATKLKSVLGHPIIKVGCEGHIVNNAFKHSCDTIKKHFNLKTAINDVFNYFHQRPKKREEFLNLKRSDVTDGNDGSFDFVKRFVVTRWLSAYQSLQSLNPNFQVLNKYFENKTKTKGGVKNSSKPSTSKTKKEDDASEYKIDVHQDAEKAANLHKFFSNSLNFAWAAVLEQITKKFHDVALKVQATNITIMEGLNLIEDLITFCQNENKKSRNDLLDQWEVKEKTNNCSENQVKELEKGIDLFLATSADYFDIWIKPYHQFKCFNWALFSAPAQFGVTANDVNNAMQMLITNGVSTLPSNIRGLYEEINYVNDTTNSSDFAKNKTTIDKWNFIFQTALNDKVSLPIMETVSSAILSISPSNSVSESIFSEIKHFWTDDKSNINFLSILSHFMIKYNLKMSLHEFAEFLSNDDAFLNSIRKTEKYSTEKLLKQTQQKVARKLFPDPDQEEEPEQTTESQSILSIYLQTFGKVKLDTQIIFDENFIPY